MSEEFIPKAGSIKIGGLGPKAARLQALREKAAAHGKSDAKPNAGVSTQAVKSKDSFAGTKKTAFQRKSV
jgi:hypothetical protein